MTRRERQRKNQKGWCPLATLRYSFFGGTVTIEEEKNEICCWFERNGRRETIQLLKVRREGDAKSFELFRTPFMHAWADVAPTGDLYPKARIAPAAIVLPYRVESRRCTILLLDQERPEIGVRVLKTVGGYLRDEEAEACMRSNLLRKIGVLADAFVERAAVDEYTILGIPIRTFETTDFRIVGEPESGCRRVEMDLREACVLASTRKLGDASSSEPILRLYFRLVTEDVIDPR